MLGYVRRQWPHHRWAVEGAQGVGRPLAQRLLADGETVVDVPAKLSARVRVFDTGNARKTDPVDAHAVAMAALRTPKLKVLTFDEELVALRLLADRRDELSALRVQTVNRLHRLFTELIPGGAPRNLSATKAKKLLAGVRPRTLVGKTTRRMAAEELADLVRVDTKLKALNRELKAAVLARGSHLMDLHGIGPGRGRADPGRRRRRRQVPRPRPLRVLDRHRTLGRLLRRPHPPPAVPRREPADEPRPLRRRDHPDPPRQRRPALLPPQAGAGQDRQGSTALPHWMTIGGAGQVGPFVGSGEGRPRCLATGWPV